MGVPKQKTLFKKYLRITMAIVLASFLLLGMVMLLVMFPAIVRFQGF